MQPLIDLDWRDVVGYEGLYQVSGCGLVRSKDREEVVTGRHPHPYKRKRKGRVIKSIISNAGYLQVGLYKNGVCRRATVHRLVCQAFKPNVEGLSEVNHINEDKLDNRASNLEWCSRSSNARHSSYKYRGSHSGKSKLRESDVLHIVKELKAGTPQTAIAKEFDVTNHTIHKIKSGKNWGWLTGLDKEGM